MESFKMYDVPRSLKASISNLTVHSIDQSIFHTDSDLQTILSGPSWRFESNSEKSNDETFVIENLTHCGTFVVDPIDEDGYVDVSHLNIISTDGAPEEEEFSEADDFVDLDHINYMSEASSVDVKSEFESTRDTTSISNEFTDTTCGVNSSSYSQASTLVLGASGSGKIFKKRKQVLSGCVRRFKKLLCCCQSKIDH